MANHEEKKIICGHMMTFTFYKRVSFAAITYVFYEMLPCGPCHFQPTWTDTAITLCFPSHNLTPVESFLHLHFCGLSGELDLRN